MIAASHLRILSGERLLSAWQQAQGESDLQRALTLLAVALPRIEGARLAQLSIPERNRLLLQLRAISFGSNLEGYARCTRCGDSMQFSAPIGALLETLASPGAADYIEWDDQGRRFRLRAANTADLLAAIELTTGPAAENLLLARCLSPVGSNQTEDACTPSSLVREHFERLHAASELRVSLDCPQCTQSTVLELDIVHFLWLEVRHAAQRLLAEIHALASHYGWSERAIARLSAQRRAAYLGFISELAPA